MALPDYVAEPARRATIERALLAVIVVVLGAGVVAAVVGGDERSRPARPQELALLHNAAAEAGAVSSGRMTMEFVISASGQRVVTGLEGAFTSDGASYTLTLPEHLGSAPTLQLAAADGMTFLEVPPDHRAATGGKAWVSAPLPPTAALEAASASPQAVLDLLSRDRIEGSEVTRRADRECRGVPTQQYRVVLDPAKVAARQEQVTGVPGALASAPETMPMTVFIDDHGLVRRMEVEMSSSGFSVEMTFEMFDIGEPVTVEVPRLEDSHPVADLPAMFGILGLPAAPA